MTVRMRCACGGTSSVDDAYRGQTTQCPHCHRTIVVPARPPAVATAAPATRPPVPRAPGGEVRAAEPARATATHRCSDCRRTVPDSELVRQGAARVCGACVARGRAALRRKGSARAPLWIGLGGLAVTALALGLYFGTRRKPSAVPAPVAATASTQEAAPAASKKASPSTAGPKPALTSAEIVAASDASVALIRLPRSSGSGFVVAQGLVATNAHVVSDGFVDEVEVVYPRATKSSRKPRRVAGFDATRDLCFLEVETPAPPLVLAARTALPRGEPLLIIGSPGLLGDLVQSNSVTQGVVGGWTEIEKARFLQISGSINPGNSGGPVFGPDGEVIAVATLKISGKEGIAFGIPSLEVLAALRALQKATAAELDAADARHRAFVAIQRMYEFGLRGVEMMALNLTAMTVAKKKGISTDVALSAAEEIVREALQSAVEGLGSYTLDRNLGILRDASGLSPEVRADLARLREVVATVHGHVTRPSGTPEAYEEALLTCRSHVRGLSDRLSAALQIRLPDIASALNDR